MARNNYSGLATRLYVDADLTTGQAVVLPADKAHFLGRVLRLSDGASLGLFNGRDGLWQASITALEKRQAVLALEQQLMAQPVTAHGPHLIMPPIKKARADWLVEKATELGVAAITPVVTEHTAVRDVKRERWRKITIEAAEQCERLTLPTLVDPQPLGQCLEQWPVDQPLFVATERLSAPLLTQAVTQTAAHAILVGPEGGFSSAELDQFGKLPFVHMISLGPQVLRAETAALAALAILNASAGAPGDASPNS